MKIPGAGNGSPTDADWQKVGALCLGPTKANVKPGEFAGVDFSFMGLNNQNLHNFLFRGFLTPWEAYTGAKIKWIDLAQADYNARLQQSIATGTADFDILEMGAPFEGDMGVKDLLSDMPDWVKTQIDFDDYVDYLKPPVGTWNGKIHRVTIDSDCHTINYRTDVFSDPDLAKQWADWKDKAGLATWGQPKTWQQVQAVTKFLKGKKVKGKDVYGFLDQPKPWGGFQFYFTGSRATAYAKYPGEKNWLFDENMKPLVNNPAWVRAIQDVIDALPCEPADQINADPGTTAFQQFLTGTGSLLEWWGDIGSMASTSDTATIGEVLDFDILPGSDDVYNFRKAEVGEARQRPEPCAEHGLSRLGHLCDEERRRRSEASEGGVERGGPSRRQGPVDVDGRLSVGLPALPQEPHQPRPVGARRLRQEVHRVLHEVAVDTPTTTRTRRSSRASPASSSIIASPRMNCRRRSRASRRRSRAPITSPPPGKS